MGVNLVPFEEYPKHCRHVLKERRGIVRVDDHSYLRIPHFFLEYFGARCRKRPPQIRQQLDPALRGCESPGRPRPVARGGRGEGGVWRRWAGLGQGAPADAVGGCGRSTLHLTTCRGACLGFIRPQMQLGQLSNIRLKKHTPLNRETSSLSRLVASSLELPAGVHVAPHPASAWHHAEADLVLRGQPQPGSAGPSCCRLCGGDNETLPLLLISCGEYLQCIW